MHTHVCRTASSSFAALRQLRSIRHLISAINIIIQSQLLLLWSSVDCTMAMAHRLAGLLTYLVGAKHSSETGIPSPSIWPHRGCTRQHPLAASAWKDYFQDCHADLSGSPMAMPAVSMAVHTDFDKDCMRSSFSDDLLVSAIRLPWMLPLPCRRRSCINDLPVDVTSAPSLHTFRKRLTLHLLDFPVLT